MQGTRRMFTIERQLSGGRASSPGAAVALSDGIKAPQSEDLSEILDTLRRIEKRLDQSAEAGPAPQVQAEAQAQALEGFAERLIEGERLKADLRELTDAIEHTKAQIAALRPAGSTDRIERAAIELDAVVLDTENATNRILAATEAIEDLGNRLAAQSNDDAMSGIADELAERVVEIFEACNFQDITGQRITKVVDTMKFIDERVHRMIEIWGEEMLSTHAEAQSDAAVQADGDTLHGPALPEQRISQDEIDALFD